MQQDNFNTQLENDREVSQVKDALRRYFKKWPWILLSMSISIFLSIIYMKFKPNSYSVETTVKVKGSNQFSDPNDLLFGRAYRPAFGKNQDEAVVLQSFPLIKTAVERLGLNITYYQLGSFGKREIYGKSPIEVKYVNHVNDNDYNFAFDLEVLNQSSFKLSSEALYLNSEFNFGDSVQTEKGVFVFQNKTSIAKGSQYHISIQSPLRATYGYQSMINVKEPESMSSLITLSLNSTIPEKAKDFLNALVEEYISQNLADKNKVADNTIDFIDEQLALISDSLKSREKSLEIFKSDSEISDVSVEAQMLLDRFNQVESDKAKHQVMQEYYAYLEKNLKEQNSDNFDQLIAPSAFGIKDEVINQLVAQLIDLNFSKKSLISEGSTESPLLRQINNRIDDVISALKESIADLSKANEIILANLNKRGDKISQKAKKLPSSERQLVNLNRLLKLNENLYLFLMEKRSNAAIQRSSNTADCKVIEPARLSKLSPVAPKRNLAYMIAALLGLFIPIAIIIFKDFLNDSIRSKDELEAKTNIPILGTIPKSKVNGNALVISERPKSALAESFRLIRANLSFFQQSKFPFKILITSSVPKEGKTFTAINLAGVLAASGKKTVLLGFDMRKPQIHNYLNMENGKGLSNYLSGHADLSELAKSTSLKNLFIITSGPTPPNPSELLMVDRTKQLFEELEKSYDYIIIDSPPVGLVTDALILKKHVDLSLFISREDYTKREFIDNLNDIYNRENGKDIGLLYNHTAKGSRYSYGYYEEAGDSMADKVKSKLKRT